MKESNGTSSWMTLAQAAECLNTTALNVLMHIKRGLLAAEEREDGWRVDPTSLDALLEKRRDGEAPAVCASGCGKTHGCQSCG